MKLKSDILGMQQGRDYMMSKVSSTVTPTEFPSAIVECHHTSKKTTCPTKSHSCKKNIRGIKSLQILEADSISNERGFSPFWSRSISGQSKKLWLPIESGAVELDLSLLNGSAINMVLNSWFSMTAKVPLSKSLLQTYSPSLQYSPVEFMDSGNTLVKSRKIRFYPTKTQKKTLFKWFGVARYVYNATVAYLRQPDTIANWKSIKTEILHKLPEWTKEVPYQIKSVAIRDACQAVIQAKKNFKKTGKFHRVKFRSRKKQDFNLYIPKSAIRETGVYVTLLGALNLRETVGKVDHDCRITLFNNRYFLSKPESSVIKIPENQRISIVALDPGVRTFQTLYDQNHVMKIGQNDFARVYRLCYQLDKIYSKRKTENTNRYGVKLKRLRWKIKDLISEIHHKLALFLVKNYDNVLVPSFETSDMVTNLHSKVARAMLGWSHYRFKEFLKFKAREYSCNIIDVNEAYTSKTCGYCGKLTNIGSKKTLSCTCGLTIDRDYNGARNIFLKNMYLAS